MTSHAGDALAATARSAPLTCLRREIKEETRVTKRITRRERGCSREHEESESAIWRAADLAAYRQDLVLVAVDREADHLDLQQNWSVGWIRVSQSLLHKNVIELNDTQPLGGTAVQSAHDVGSGRHANPDARNDSIEINLRLEDSVTGYRIPK